MKIIANYYRRALKSQIRKMGKTVSSYCKHPGKNFTRDRVLNFETIISFMLTLSGKSLSNEILDFFQPRSRFPTVSAFIQQRNKLLPSVFQDLFMSFSKDNIPNRTFKGYRLLAVDGTELSAPPNPEEKECYFPAQKGKKHYNLLHIHALYDLLSKTYVDTLVEGGQVFDERRAFNQMIDRSYIPEAIAIADRGYESYNVIAHCLNKGWKFLIRAKDGTSGSIISGLTLPDAEEFDAPVSLVLGRSRTKEARSIENYKALASNTVFDFLPLSSKGNCEIHTFEMNFRVVRFPISENSYEVVLTNLPVEDFPPDVLKELYAARWGIETSFRYLKKNIGLELVHAKKVESILHEIFARMIVYNFTALIAYQTSIREILGKYIYKPSFSNAVLICRHLFQEKISPLKAEESIARFLTPIRPDRSTPRSSSKTGSVSFNSRLA